ncbi:efflux RND transporter periplasmic adaptor subunit [Clostridiaceae bacterium]|nr:efflux RND transporter periplasmic adaptor subunit [Clostridiaceae bacterium]RKI15578.1 efflux RND transporter periplasmic adaptor subunit [bacterium 1XD21-70]
MTDQEFEKGLAELMAEDAPGKKKKTKKGKKNWRFWKSWSRKKKIIAGVVVVAAALFVAVKGKGNSGEGAIMVSTVPLAKGDVEEILSISGPVSGTDSAEVVSRLHAEIEEILVKEGDKVKAGQVLARLDPADVQKEVEIAQNAYDLAVAEKNEAQIQAEAGYGKARQDEQAAKRDYDRKAMLFAGGDVSQMELEAARDALAEASRQVSTFTLQNGRPVASDSYFLRIKNAEFELEKKKKQLEEVEVTSPIDGTVVRVNSRVGRFADTVDDDRPLFSIDNLENLEMKINVSEYSIGKVKVGQKAQISADILGGETEEGVISSISPTGEEKGSGSSERVIPTTIQIQNPHTKLIAGITARAQIVLNESKDTWVVPMGALVEKEGQTFLAAVEGNVVKMIPVETGVESDVDVEVKGEGLAEGIFYIPSPMPFLEDGMAVTASPMQ